MRLDWNDIKARAAKFAGDWNGAQYERDEAQTFYNDFFQLFGVTRRRVASFEHGVNLPDKKRGYLDLFWKGKLLVEQKSELYDLDIAPDRPVCFRLPELPDYVQDFGIIAGQERRVFRDQDPVNILASEIMGKRARRGGLSRPQARTFPGPPSVLALRRRHGHIPASRHFGSL